MKSHIANVLDLELNDWEIIEFGITTVDLKSREILQTYSIPVAERYLPLRPDIAKLTGWTDKMLDRQGIPFDQACHKIKEKYGGRGRLLITDSEQETQAIRRNIHMRWDSLSWKQAEVFPFGLDQINVSSLFKIKTGDFTNRSLTDMLDAYGLEFEGSQHRASDDSFNIARLFLKLME